MSWMKNKVSPRAILLATALPFLLVACSAGPLTVEESPAPTVTTPNSAPVTTGPESSAAGSSDDPLDNGGYAEYTWDDYVKGKRKMSGLTSWPEVDRVRYVSPEERADVQAKCLTSLGFPTSVESNGSYLTESTADQDEALAEASYTCELQYPTDLRYAQAFTRTQLKTIYAYYRDDLIPCLQNQGQNIGQLPSEETYVEGMTTGNAGWTPYDSLNLESIDTDAMNEACPGMPASDVLYGG